MRIDRKNGRSRLAAGLMILIAAAAALTGCGKVSQGYTVEGGDDERSLVTDESFAAMYATMACAQDEEMDGSWTEYEGSSYAAEGAAEVAPEEEEGRKWRTILEDVSLFSSPENGRVLIVVPKGSKVDVLTKKQDGWYQIRYRKTGKRSGPSALPERKRRPRRRLRKRPGRRPRKRLRRRRKRKQERRPRKRPGRRRKKRPKRRLRKRLQGSPRRKRQKKRGKPKKPLRPLKKPDSKLKKRPGRKLKRKRQERLRKKRGLRREPGQWPPER